VLAVQEYHMVSHSQRAKLSREEGESKREERPKPKARNPFETDRLAEISENPENARPFARNVVGEERSKVDASPNFSKGLNRQ
jgi:hypothetical protein